MKYDYRIVSRLSLADLERAVRKLMLDGYEIHNEEHGDTLAQALMKLYPRGSTYGISPRVAVSMRKESSDG
jgi:hypothetical protein